MVCWIPRIQALQQSCVTGNHNENEYLNDSWYCFLKKEGTTLGPILGGHLAHVWDFATHSNLKYVLRIHLDSPGSRAISQSPISRRILQQVLKMWLCISTSRTWTAFSMASHEKGRCGQTEKVDTLRHNLSVRIVPQINNSQFPTQLHSLFAHIAGAYCRREPSSTTLKDRVISHGHFSFYLLDVRNSTIFSFSSWTTYYKSCSYFCGKNETLKGASQRGTQISGTVVKWRPWTIFNGPLLKRAWKCFISWKDKNRSKGHRSMGRKSHPNSSYFPCRRHCHPSRVIIPSL